MSTSTEDRDGIPTADEMQCAYDKGWAGRCRNLTTGAMCPTHAALKCSSCGAPATQDCDETMGPCVCGAPLCDNCEHELAENGTNGMSMEHCRKDAQKHKPWYMQATETASLTESPTS